MLDSSLYDPMSPKTVGDIVGNAELWSALYAQIKEQTTGHLVCVGPAGCGKSLFFRIALVGYKVLHIDCTANSGLREMRDALRTFARGSKAATDLRWIVLEHADMLSSDTQAFLRRCLETTAGTTRVAFLCRDAGAISEPILSRTTLVTVDSPEDTEIAYELMRRTEYKIEKTSVDGIVTRCYGNMRSALTEALAARHCSIATDDTVIPALLASRPGSTGVAGIEWVSWAIQALLTCKNEGIDLRDVLRRGWPKHPAVSQTCATWSRLGGTSPRSLFFACISKLVRP